MKEKIKLGMIGGGEGSLIGVIHRIAAGMQGHFEIAGGVFNSSIDRSRSFAKEHGIEENRVYANVSEMIEAEKLQQEPIQAVTIATPNNLHFEAASELIAAGFHVICEKPITMSAQEALKLEELVRKNNVIFGVTHTYTGYPMVREMRSIVASGKLGRIQKIDSQYFQGWINPFIHVKSERSRVWRLDPDISGISCCMGDIGVHAFNMIEYVSGLTVDAVLADIDTMYEDNPLDVDGNVLLRMSNGSRGLIRASQIATGEENNFNIAIYGEKGSLKWEQEKPNYLTFLQDGQPIQVLKPGNTYNSRPAKESVKLPAGHPEGIFDAMGNIYTGVAKAIRGEVQDKGAFPDIRDGVRGMKFIETVVYSSSEGNIWKKID